MNRPAYISATGQCLPGEPVGNAQMARHIGIISKEGLRMGRLFLRRNRIRTRHYAIGADGTSDWTLARLGAAAVSDCLERAGLDSEGADLSGQRDHAERLHGARPRQRHPGRGAAAAARDRQPAKRLRQRLDGAQGGRGAKSDRASMRRRWRSAPNFPAAISSPVIYRGTETLLRRRHLARRCRIPALDALRRRRRRARRAEAGRARASRCASTGSACAPSPTASRLA